MMASNPSMGSYKIASAPTQMSSNLTMSIAGENKYQGIGSFKTSSIPNYSNFKSSGMSMKMGGSQPFSITNMQHQTPMRSSVKMNLSASSAEL